VALPSIPKELTSKFVSTPAPEPETYALMLEGLGVMGFVAKRRTGLT